MDSGQLPTQNAAQAVDMKIPDHVLEVHGLHPNTSKPSKPAKAKRERLCQLTLHSPPPEPADYSAARKPWRERREAAFNDLHRHLNEPQRQLLTALLAVHAEEHQYTGAAHGAAASHRATRALNGQAMQEAARTADERRANNAQTYELLAKAAADNNVLRGRAEEAEEQLAALRATLPNLERTIRASIIAGTPLDHPRVPRLAPHSGIYAKHLSHTVLIAQTARTIEEFVNGDLCRGYARPEKIQEFLPWLRKDILGQALTHLLKSRRLRKTASGAYRLTDPVTPE